MKDRLLTAAVLLFPGAAKKPFSAKKPRGHTQQGDEKVPA